MAENLTTCRNCGKPLRGRSDKKYCNDACRNTHNNHLKAPGTNYVRNINNALSRNRHILATLLQERELARTCREKLLLLGFQFRYLTHFHITPKGNTYHFCYEYGYLMLDNNRLLIVKEKEAV